MADLNLQPPGGQADTVWPKVPTINHIVSTDCLAWTEASGKQRHSYQAGHSRAESLLFVADQGPNLSPGKLKPLLHIRHKDSSPCSGRVWRHHQHDPVSRVSCRPEPTVSSETQVSKAAGSAPSLLVSPVLTLPLSELWEHFLTTPPPIQFHFWGPQIRSCKNLPSSKLPSFSVFHESSCVLTKALKAAGTLSLHLTPEGITQSYS